jgi:hypothetical protein
MSRALQEILQKEGGPAAIKACLLQADRVEDCVFEILV